MMSQFHLMLTLAAKDWHLFWADRRAALLCFAVPIVLASAFGLVFHRGPGQATAPKLPLVIVAENAGPFTRSVVERLMSGPRVEAESATRGEAEARVVDRRPGVLVEFPPEFESLASWTPGAAVLPPCVSIRHHPLAATEAQWAEGVVSEAIMKRLADDKLAPLLALSGQRGGTTLPFTVETTAAVGEHERRFNAYTHSFCGMTLQYLLFWGMESGLLFLRERRRSLWLRLRAAPVPLSTMLCGKALATAGIALLLVMTTFAFGWVVFDVRIDGSALGFFLLALGAGALSAVTGLLVAAVGGTEARARSVCILVILGVSMLGGLWLPSFVLPGWARDLALCLPTTWAMRGLDAVTWQGQGLPSVLPNIGVLAGFTGLFLAVAVAKFVTTEGRRRRGGLG